jgi:Flp pilus assembly pilin Flp
MRQVFENLCSEDGQDIAEYAVMVAVILIIVVATVRLIGSNSNTVFSSGRECDRLSFARFFHFRYSRKKDLTLLKVGVESSRPKRATTSEWAKYPLSLYGKRAGMFISH